LYSREREGLSLRILQIIGHPKFRRYKANVFKALPTSGLDRRYKALGSRDNMLHERVRLKKVVLSGLMRGDLEEYIALTLRHDGWIQRVAMTIHFQMKKFSV
jgi:hypothetical protein